MCAFQVRSALIVGPSNLAALTTSTSFLSITTASSSTGHGFRANEIRSSLHSSGFELYSIWDHSITWLIILYALLVFPFGTTSDAEVSSTNLHKCGVFISKSIILYTKSHGPNLVPLRYPMRFLSGIANKGELRIYYLGRNKTTKHDFTQFVSKFLCRQPLMPDRCEPLLSRYGTKYASLSNSW